jgi:LysM repeat protein
MRSVFLVSLVLNVVLAVALVTWFTSTPDHQPRVVRPINAAAVNSNYLPRIVKTNVLVRPRAFTWREIESPDYATYVQNLRELGMPEPTIRDIIVADVDQLFIKRKRGEDAKQDLEWWRATPSPTVQSNILARTQALENERAALLEKLLGPDWDKGRVAEERAPLPLTGPVLGNMSDDVKASVQAISARSQDLMASYLADKQARGEQPNPAEMARIREETRQQLAAVMSPQQLDEFLIRYSDTANRLRDQFAGLNVTPEEFRSLFRAVDQIDRDIQLRFSGDDAASQRSRQALEQQRLAAIRGALDPERFAAYQMARDPAYQTALTTAQQAGGNEETARALYEIQRATADEVARIRNDPQLSDAQKQLLLQQTTQEQQKARATVLGEETSDVGGLASAPVQPQVRTHVLEPFETLGRLSQRYGVTFSELREANPSVDINRARPGTVIVIPPQGSLVSPLPLPPGLRR